MTTKAQRAVGVCNAKCMMRVCLFVLASVLLGAGARGQGTERGNEVYSLRAPAVATACAITLTDNHLAELHVAYGEAFQ